MSMYDEKAALYDAKLQEIIKYDGYTLMKTIKYKRILRSSHVWSNLQHSCAGLFPPG